MIFVQFVSYVAPVYAQETTIPPTPTTIQSTPPPPSPSPQPETTPMQDWADPTITPTPTTMPSPTLIVPTISPTGTTDITSPTTIPSLLESQTNGTSARIKKRGKMTLDKLFKRNFGAGEKIKTRLINADENNLDIKVSYGKIDKIDVVIQKKLVNDEIELTILPPQKFKPGKYRLTIIQADGETVVQDFTWGVLAINTHKSIYTPQEKANIAIAVLNESGGMVCDAAVTLKISNSQLNINDELSTKNGKIIVNDACKQRAYSLKPDYETNYQVGGAGRYTMTLTAETKNGVYTITDSFEVREVVPFDIERITATRIYPQDKYPVELKITANQDFEGQIIETVPEEFIIENTEGKPPYETINAVSKQFSSEASDSASLIDLSYPFAGEFIQTLDFGDDIEDEKLKAQYTKFGLQGHDGVDFNLPMGTPVLASDNGEVILAGAGAYGETVVLQHAWGRTYYGHLSEIEVEVGQSVTKGAQLGLSGKTGLATGPHLHFGIKLQNNEFRNGYFGKTDPNIYLNKKTIISSYQVQEIVWNVSVKKGEQIMLGYTYDSPNISPQFYLLGPLRFETTDEKSAVNPFLLGVATGSAELEQPQKKSAKITVFEEARQWQLAVDTAVTVVSDRDLGTTTTTNSWANQSTITLTADGSWLVLTTFDFGVDNATTNGEVRLQQDDTTDLQYGRYEDMIATESYKNWYWMTRVERSGSNVKLDLDYKSMGAGVTARMRNAMIIAIRLNDLGTEDTDWRWAENNSTLTNVNNNFTDSDGIIVTETWTPATEEDWIIMANTEFTANSTTVNAEARLSHNDETATYDYAEHEGEDTAEWLWWSSLRSLTLPASEQKFEIQTKSDNATPTTDVKRGRFFAVKESVFDQVVEFRADSFTSPTSANNWEEKLNASFTPNQTEDVLILGHASIFFGATARIGRTRIHEAESTAVMNNDDSAADSQSIWSVALADVINMSSLYNADMDINASNTSVTFGDAAVIFVSLTLAGGGGAETPTNAQLMRHGAWFNSSGVEQPFTF